MNPIRVDSCRKCGEELQVLKLCNDCHQPLNFECSNCNAFVDDPIHQHGTLTSQSFLQHFGVNANQSRVSPRGPIFVPNKVKESKDLNHKLGVLN